MPCSSHPSWLDHSNYTWTRVKVMKFFIMQFSGTFCHFICLRSKYCPQHPVLRHNFPSRFDNKKFNVSSAVIATSTACFED
jgi:hypothetical protein